MRQIINIALSDVRVDNPVTLTKNYILGDIAFLSISLAQQGQLVPIVITEDNILIDGFRRVAAAKHIGWSYLYAEIMTEQEMARNAIVMKGKQ